MAQPSGSSFESQHPALARRARESGRTFYQQRSYEETQRAEKQGFKNRREWVGYRKEHKDIIAEIDRGDSEMRKAWNAYEGGDPRLELKKSTEFAEARRRINRVRRSRKIPSENKKAIQNAIMHEYMKTHHKRMSNVRRERIVWDFEGETP